MAVGGRAASLVLGKWTCRPRFVLGSCGYGRRDEDTLLADFLWESHTIEVAASYVFEHMNPAIDARTK